MVAQRANKTEYACVYAAELAQLRKIEKMVSSTKISMEQVQIRLETISDLGDVVAILSPCMSVMKKLSSSLRGLVPEANSSIQDLSQMLEKVISDSSVDVIESAGQQQQEVDSIGSTPDMISIMKEVHEIIEGQTKSALPDVPKRLGGSISDIGDVDSAPIPDTTLPQSTVIDTSEILSESKIVKRNTQKGKRQHMIG